MNPEGMVCVDYSKCFELAKAWNADWQNPQCCQCLICLLSIGLMATRQHGEKMQFLHWGSVYCLPSSPTGASDFL